MTQGKLGDRVVDVRIVTGMTDGEIDSTDRTSPPEYVHVGDIDTGGGVWVSYYYDHSGAKIHSNELDAMRAGVRDSSVVRFVPYGEDVFQWAEKP